MSRSVIPGWAIRALQEFIVRHGISSNEALRQVIIAETDCIVPDTPNRSRQVYAGEKHPLSVFMSKRTARNIATREDTKRMMVERSEAHKREMAVKAEEVDRLLAQQLKMMAQGVRPVLNEVGEAVKEGGRQRVERLPPAVHVQAIGAASAWAARQNPTAQKVEMEHSGGVKVEVPYAEEVAALRARISA
jgi:hypothetical protein